MKRTVLSRIILVSLGLLIVILVISAISAAIRSAGSQPVPINELLVNNNDRAVEMVIRGPIVADEKFKTYSIKISPDERRVTSYNGYSLYENEYKALPNTYKAYDEFIHALNKANLMLGDELPSDLRGTCATGKVYEFKLMKGAKVVKTLWTSTCSGAKGTLKANLNQVYNLFTNQIPDAKKYLK